MESSPSFRREVHFMLFFVVKTSVNSEQLSSRRTTYRRATLIFVHEE